MLNGAGMKDEAGVLAETNRQKCIPGFWFRIHHLLSRTTAICFFCIISAVGCAPLRRRPSSMMVLFCAANRDVIASTKFHRGTTRTVSKPASTQPNGLGGFLRSCSQLPVGLDLPHTRTHGCVWAETRVRVCERNQAVGFLHGAVCPAMTSFKAELQQWRL